MVSPRLYHGRTKREVRSNNFKICISLFPHKHITSELPSKNKKRGLVKIFKITYFPLKCVLPQVQSSHSKEEEGGHAHHLTVAWVDDKTGKDIVVDLNLNRDLIPESYSERYHHQVNIIELDVELAEHKGNLYSNMLKDGMGVKTVHI